MNADGHDMNSDGHTPAGFPRGEDDGPTPIRLGNLHAWARATLRTDRRDYRGKGEPISWPRVARAIAPRIDDAIFVIGAARSGTTFLGRCLGALPEIGYHHEPVATKAAARCVYQATWSDRTARLYFRSVLGWLARVHLDGHLRLGIKNPTDSFIVPFLARAFPRAQFIHIVRDGRDAALSDSRQPWLAAASAGSGRREEGGYLYGPTPRFWVEPERLREWTSCSDIRRCAWAWRRAVEAALRDGPPLGSARYIEVRYETLVAAGGDDRARAAAASESERLLDFLGIHAGGSRNRFRAAAAHANASSVGGWRRDLAPSQVAEIEAEAGPLLRKLGYQG